MPQRASFLSSNLPTFLSEAFRAYPDPLFIKDREFRYLFVNDAFAKFVGLTSEELIGRDDFEVIPTDVAATCRTNDQRALEAQLHSSSRISVASEEVFDANDEKRILEVRRYVLFDTAEQPHIFGAVRDLTESFRKEDRLRKSLRASESLRRETKQQLGDVLEMIDEVVWSIRCDNWMPLFVSPAAERVYGRPIAELMRAEEWSKVFPPEENRRILREFEFAAMSGNETFSGDFKFRHPERGERIAFIRGRIVRDSAGKPTRIDGLTTDVTENRRALKELEENRQKLFALSKLNTLGELASGIGHEINTPLTGILSKIARVERLFEEGRAIEPEERCSGARLLRESMEIVNRVSQIVDGLKQLSRNQQNDDLELFDPVTSVEQALSLSRARFSNHGFRIEFERPKQRLECFGKPTTLFQSLVNLLNNSFDALEERLSHDGWRGSESVTIALERDEGRVRLRVVDTGVGVDEDFKPKLFEAFQTTKAEGKGTGLGLSISRRLLRAQGGDLRLVASVPGRTEFEITLPETAAT